MFAGTRSLSCLHPCYERFVSRGQTDTCRLACEREPHFVSTTLVYTEYVYPPLLSASVSSESIYHLVQVFRLPRARAAAIRGQSYFGGRHESPLQTSTFLHRACSCGFARPIVLLLGKRRLLYCFRWRRCSLYSSSFVRGCCTPESFVHRTSDRFHFCTAKRAKDRIKGQDRRTRMSYSGGFKEEYDLEDDEEGEEEGQGGEMKTVNDHCILLIDARPNMFEPLNDDGDVRPNTKNTNAERRGDKLREGATSAITKCLRSVQNKI